MTNDDNVGAIQADRFGKLWSQVPVMSLASPIPQG